MKLDKILIRIVLLPIIPFVLLYVIIYHLVNWVLGRKTPIVE